MKKIEKWLSQFQSSWKTHDIEKVLSLFSKDVEYWETPFLKVSSFGNLRKEWEYVKGQQNISIETEVFSAVNDKYTVKWQLIYTDDDNNTKTFRGVYLITLDSSDRCNYFFHCGELGN
ncbi:MAG: nuclear transport factor 2 family protein [Candidatus Moraniibacteriota bacterium]|jgi:SnoaL-like protein